MKQFLEDAGFKDVVQNADGTFDATKDNQRYKGLYMSACDTQFEDNDVIVSTPVKFDRL